MGEDSNRSAELEAPRYVFINVRMSTMPSDRTEAALAIIVPVIYECA